MHLQVEGLSVQALLPCFCCTDWKGNGIGEYTASPCRNSLFIWLHNFLFWPLQQRYGLLLCLKLLVVWRHISNGEGKHLEQDLIWHSCKYLRSDLSSTLQVQTPVNSVKTYYEQIIALTMMLKVMKGIKMGGKYHILLLTKPKRILTAANFCKNNIELQFLDGLANGWSWTQNHDGTFSEISQASCLLRLQY